LGEFHISKYPPNRRALCYPQNALFNCGGLMDAENPASVFFTATLFLIIWPNTAISAREKKTFKSGSTSIHDLTS
jgi:hypothetical protein